MKRLILTLSLLVTNSSIVMADNGLEDVVGGILRDGMRQAREQREIGWYRPEIKQTLEDLCKDAPRFKQCKREQRQMIMPYMEQFPSATAALFSAVVTIEDLQSQILTLQQELNQANDNSHRGRRRDRSDDRRPSRRRQEPTPQGDFVEFFSKYSCEHEDQVFVLNNLDLSQYQNKYTSCLEAHNDYQDDNKKIRSVKINGDCKNIKNVKETVMDSCMGVSHTMETIIPKVEVTLYSNFSCKYSNGSKFKGKTFIVNKKPEMNQYILENIHEYQAYYSSNKFDGVLALTNVKINNKCYNLGQVLPGQRSISNAYYANDVAIMASRNIVRKIIKEYDYYLNL